MVAEDYGENVRDGFKALGPASLAALALGLAVYLLEGSVVGAILLAAGVATIVLVLLGFPAQRQVGSSGPNEHPPKATRRPAHAVGSSIRP
jgi:hypothetical protein